MGTIWPGCTARAPSSTREHALTGRISCPHPGMHTSSRKRVGRHLHAAATSRSGADNRPGAWEGHWMVCPVLWEGGEQRQSCKGVSLPDLGLPRTEGEPVRGALVRSLFEYVGSVGLVAFSSVVGLIQPAADLNKTGVRGNVSCLTAGPDTGLSSPWTWAEPPTLPGSQIPGCRPQDLPADGGAHQQLRGPPDAYTNIPLGLSLWRSQTDNVWEQAAEGGREGPTPWAPCRVAPSAGTLLGLGFSLARWESERGWHCVLFSH